MSLTDKVLVNIIGSSSNNSDFTEQRERDTIDPSDEAVYLLVTAWFLLSELVAGEGHHIEVIGPKVPLELLQIFVVLLSEATFTGYIHNQGHLKTQKHTTNALHQQSKRLDSNTQQQLLQETEVCKG